MKNYKPSSGDIIFAKEKGFERCSNPFLGILWVHRESGFIVPSWALSTVVEDMMGKEESNDTPSR